MNELIGKVEVGYLSAAYLLGDSIAEVISFFIGLLLISTLVVMYILVQE